MIKRISIFIGIFAFSLILAPTIHAVNYVNTVEGIHVLLESADHSAESDLTALLQHQRVQELISALPNQITQDEYLKSLTL